LSELVSELTFEPETHEYRVAGRRVLSVTQALKLAGLISTDWYTDESARNGQAIHRILEELDSGITPAAGETKRHEHAIVAYKRFRSECSVECHEIEAARYNRVYDFAGTPDRVIQLNGTSAVLDIKTGGPQDWHPLQTAGYALLVDPAIDRFALYLRRDGSYRLSRHSSHHDFSVFLAALAVSRWKTRV
jgi:hypothetical protein